MKKYSKAIAAGVSLVVAIVGANFAGVDVGALEAVLLTLVNVGAVVVSPANE